MGGLTRRQFGFAAAAVGLWGLEAMAQPVTPTVQLPDGTRAPALGQGSATLAQGRHPAAEEEDALRIGIAGRARRRPILRGAGPLTRWDLGQGQRHHATLARRHIDLGRRACKAGPIGPRPANPELIPA